MFPLASHFSSPSLFASFLIPLVLIVIRKPTSKHVSQRKASRGRTRRKLRRTYEPLPESILLYQCTTTSIPNTFYEKPSEGAHSLEIHFEARIAGDIHTNRERLADFAVQLYQRKAKELYNVDFAPSQVKVRFEIEELAFETSPNVIVDSLEMTYVGKQVQAQRFPTETIRLEPEHTEQEFRVRRDNLVDAYARGYRDGSIAAGHTTKPQTARRYGRRVIDTLGHEEIWSWEERDA